LALLWRFNITASLGAGDLAPKRSLALISSPEKAKVLVDPMRREILRLLSGKPMTQNELAETLGLSNPSVAHHLKLLLDIGLVGVQREEKELHGIMQKFYETTSLAYFVDTRKLPLDIQRYFMPTNVERVRGILVALNATKGQASLVPAKDLEEFAVTMASTIAQIARKYEKFKTLDREEVIAKVQFEALRHLISRPELTPESVRKLLTSCMRKD
jgi:predicted transcriptional regulator